MNRFFILIICLFQTTITTNDSDMRHHKQTPPPPSHLILLTGIKSMLVNAALPNNIGWKLISNIALTRHITIDNNFDTATVRQGTLIFYISGLLAGSTLQELFRAVLLPLLLKRGVRMVKLLIG